MYRAILLSVLSLITFTNARTSRPISLPFAEKVTVAQLENILAKGADINSTDSLGRTLLECAAATGSVDLVKRVASLKMKLNDTDGHGGNALGWAVYSGNLACIRYLRSLGVPYVARSLMWLDTIGKDGYYGSTLNCAAGKATVPLESLKYLIDSCKADVNELEQASDGSHTGWAPVHWAVSGNDTAKLGFLVSRKANLNLCSNEEGATPLSLAILDSNTAIVNLLVKHGATLAYDTATGNQLGPLSYLVNTCGFDTGIGYALKYGVKPEDRVADDSSVTLLALAVAGPESCFDTAFSHAIKTGKKIADGYALMNALYLLKPSIAGKLFAAGAPLGQLREFLFTPGSPAFSTVKAFFPGSPYTFDDTMPRALRDSLLCECIGIVDRPAGPLFKKDQERNALFVECVKNGFSRCANYLLDQGIPLPCVQDDETDLFASAIGNGDSLLIEKMAKNGGRVAAKSFLFSGGGRCSCGPLARTFALARNQQVPDTNLPLLRNALIAGVKAGCPDLVRSLYPLAEEALSRSAKPDDSASDDADTLGIGASELLGQAVRGTSNSDVVRFLLGKKIAPAAIETIFSEPDDLRSMSPEVFEILIKQVPSRWRKTVDIVIIANFGRVEFSSPVLPVFLMKRYRAQSGESSMIGLIYGALHNHYADSLFPLCGFPASRREMRILAAASLLNGDTAKVSELRRKGIKLPSRGKDRKPLIVECILGGNERGFTYLEKQVRRSGKSAIKKLYLEFMNSALDRETGYSSRQDSESVKIIESLFALGAKIDWTGRDRVPMIRKALENNNTAFARVLVAHGAAPQSTDSLGRTALYHAIDDEDIAFVKLLLAKGAHADMLVDPTAIAITKKRHDKPLYESGEESSDDDDHGIPALATQSPLQFACSKGNVAIAGLLIGAGATIDHQDTGGTTPLMEAAQNGGPELCSLLTAAGAKIELQTNDDVPRTALGMAVEKENDSCTAVIAKAYRDRSLTVSDPALLCNACKSGFPLPLIQDLVSIGCDINGRDNDGQTPIFKTMYANPSQYKDTAREGNWDRIFEYLVKQKADLSVVDESGKNLLAWAISENDSAKIRYFLVMPSLINGRDHTGATPLLQVASAQNIAGAKLLLDHKADLQSKDNDGNTALHAAVTNEDTAMAALLLERKAEVNAKNNEGKSPLLLAAEKGDRKLVELLLKSKADVRVVLPDGTSLLHVAAGHGDTMLTRLCLKAGLNINGRDAQGETALLKAVKNDVASAYICRLIKEGADPSIRNNNNESVLHDLAKSTTVYPCLEQIIAATKDIDAVDNEGKTPLLSSSTADTPLFDLLLKKGASLDKKDNDGNTVLILAAGSDRNDHVAKVLERKIPPSVLDAKNNDGKTALISAVAENNYIGSTLLLNAGAAVNTADENGETPLKLAAGNNNPAMINALRRHGAVARGGTGKLREYAGQNAIGKDAERLVELLSMPVDKLPPLPQADFAGLEGYWWCRGTAPLSGFHAKECIVVKDSEKTLETTDEVLKFTVYAAKILSKEGFGGDDGLQSVISLSGNNLIFRDKENLCTYSKEGTALIICSPSRETCDVYQFAGKTFDEEKFKKRLAEKE